MVVHGECPHSFDVTGVSLCTPSFPLAERLKSWPSLRVKQPLSASETVDCPEQVAITPPPSINDLHELEDIIYTITQALRRQFGATIAVLVLPHLTPHPKKLYTLIFCAGS